MCPSSAASESASRDSYQTTVCRSYNLTGIGSDGLDAILESIVSELTVEKTDLSQTIRKKISAPDPRVSSKSIGAIAVCVIFLPFVGIFLVDMPGIIRDMRSSFLGLKRTSIA